MRGLPSNPDSESIVELRPRGNIRYAEAIFLIVWLTFWLLGELLVAGVILTGIFSLLTGAAVTGNSEPLELSPALLVGSFLLVWLIFWTVGGIAALIQLCSLVWAKDTLSLSSNGLSLTTQIGPVVKKQLFPTSSLQAAYVRSYQNSLMLQAAGRLHLISNLGTVGERKQAAELIRKAFSLQPTNSPIFAEALPDDWSESVDGEGRCLLRPNPEKRRHHYYACLAASILCWIVAYALAVKISETGAIAIPALVAGLIATWLSRQSSWLKHGHYEWVAEQGKLILRKFYRGQTEDLGTVSSLELSSSVDSDSDTWYELNVAEESGVFSKRSLRNLTKNMHDDTEARLLAAWFAAHSKVNVRDLTARKYIASP